MNKRMSREAQHSVCERPYILESCVDSVESAVIATEAGACRLELCANLITGGTTPTLATFRQVRKRCNNTVHVLIRPRYGDFCYTADEFEIIKEEIRLFSKEGADGIVIGILKADGSLDVDRMSILIKEAKGMSITLHRAFDVCADPFQALQQAIDLKIHTILTSGQKNNCLEGKACLEKLAALSAGRISIMAGGGVDASVIEKLYDTGIRAYHMSGKTVLQSPMTYRNKDVHMGLDNLDEFEIWRTQDEKIRSAVSVLRRLSNNRHERLLFVKR